MTFPNRGVDPAAQGREESGAESGSAWSTGQLSTNIIVNSSSPPFDNLDIRRAMALGA